MNARRDPTIAPPAKLLVAIFDARDEWQGAPLEDALIRVLEAEGVSGATLLSGVTGYGAHRSVHPRGLIRAPHDKPAVLLVIDNEHTLRRVLPTIRGMIEQGIVVLSDAEVIPLP